MANDEDDLRREIIAQCKAMNASGLNHGVSGNISARFGGAMLITPSGVPYDSMTPEMIASVDLADADAAWSGPFKPSTEWPFHHAIYRGRAEVQAVVHAHPIHCTALAMARKPIPQAHYMVAIFGGKDVRVADYATFGSSELSDAVMEALQDRMACLMANHGMVALGENIEKAMWRAVELEVLAHQYCVSLQIGGPVLLSNTEMEDAMARIRSYGMKSR